MLMVTPGKPPATTIAWLVKVSTSCATAPGCSQPSSPQQSAGTASIVTRSLPLRSVEANSVPLTRGETR